MVNEMVTELFETVDNCIIQLEESKEHMQEVAKVLLVMGEDDKENELK